MGQSFVVEVEGTGVTSVRSSELSGGFMAVGRNQEPVIGENTSIVLLREPQCLKI